MVAHLQKSSISNQNQGGGNSKAGIPSTIGISFVANTQIKARTNNLKPTDVISPSLLPSSAEFTGTWANVNNSFTLNADQQYENLIVPDTSTLISGSLSPALITAKTNLILTLQSDPGIPAGSGTVTITF